MHDTALRTAVESVTAALDGVFAGGTWIPPQVGEAVHTLAAFDAALAANAAGQPVPEPYRSALGLPPLTTKRPA